MDKFIKSKKYSEGDQVEYKKATYRVEHTYDDGTVEMLKCDCDANREGSHCSNCSAERYATDYDEEYNMDYEWGQGFVEKATVFIE